MAESSIVCPNCHHEFALTDAVATPLLEEARQSFEAALLREKKEAESRQAVAVELARSELQSRMSEREVDLSKKMRLLEESRARLDAEVQQKLGAERQKIAAEEAAKIRLAMGNDLSAKAEELTALKAILEDKNQKLSLAMTAQAELLAKKRELEDAQQALQLTIQQKVEASLTAVREKTRAEVEDTLKLKLGEKEEVIAGLQRKIEELARKADQGSQQLQGEVLELELEATLRSRFPRDVIEPVPKGEFGGDVLHRVVGPGDLICGTILWETKRTKNWSDGWLAKLRDDQRAAKAEVSLLVSEALPKGVHTFDHLDGVWVTSAACMVPVAIALRQTLVQLAGVRQAQEGQQTKTELVYAYLTGSRFRHRVEAIVERFSEMQADLDRERKAMTRLWAKREGQIRAVIESTVGMYGDLQGIAGRALQEIEALDVLSIAGPEAET